jgi:hypothetical protein
MQRDANLASLESEIEKQKGLIREQIDALDSEMLTKPDVLSVQALAELAKIRKKYEIYSNKVKDYQENEEVLEVEHQQLEEVKIFEERFYKRHTLWNNRNIFAD